MRYVLLRQTVAGGKHRRLRTVIISLPWEKRPWHEVAAPRASTQDRQMDQTDRYLSRRGEFDHVYWICGGSSSGKSSIANALAQEYGLGVCHTDKMVLDLIRRADPDIHPAVARLRPIFEKGFEEWLQYPAEQYFELLFEWFSLLLEDIKSRGNQNLVVEGMPLNPSAVVEIAAPERVVCLTATESFLRTEQLRRRRAEDPERFLRILTEGHLRMTLRYEKEAAKHGIHHLITDESTDFETQLNAVKQHFGVV